MTSDGLESAVLVRIALPPALDRLRRRTWPIALAGVPSHVTILYPFLPAAELDDVVRARLAAIARTVPAFDARFARVKRFPTSIYLAPEPAAPFRRLTRAVEAVWPDHPPYGGEFAAIVPHLTIVEGHPATDAVAAAAAARLPFTVQVRAVEVIEEGATGRWRRRWRIPLGGAPVRR